VKVHRVFPSSHKYSASSRKLQFHWINSGDSGEVVTSLMQVNTYLTRNFATLGPLGLQPPFNGTYDTRIIPVTFIYHHWADVRLYTSFFNFAKSCVFIKQSPSPNLLSPKGASIFLSYRSNLPSSFSTIFSKALVFSTYLSVSICSTVISFPDFLNLIFLHPTFIK